MRTHIPRIIVRMLGKCITFSFALFCVITGLTQTASGESVTGTVRCRSSLAPLPGIRVVLADAICPLYGCNPCSSGDALDTTTTDSVGKFEFQDPKPQGSGYFLHLEDVDGEENGRFYKRSTLARETVYMLPVDSTTRISGSVSRKTDSTAIPEIRVELVAVSTPMCAYYESLVEFCYTDEDGRFDFELEPPPEGSKYLIKILDEDGLENGGVFLPKHSVRFDAYYSPGPYDFYLEIDPASDVTGQQAKVNQSEALPVVSNGSVSMHLPNLWNTGETDAVITNARGAMIARLTIKDGQIVWHTEGIARGMYCFRLAQPHRDLTIPFVLP